MEIINIFGIIINFIISLCFLWILLSTSIRSNYKELNQNWLRFGIKLIIIGYVIQTFWHVNVIEVLHNIGLSIVMIWVIMYNKRIENINKD